MTDLDEILAAETDSDRLNHDLATAAVLAQKVADQKGVDIDSLTDDQVSHLLSIATGVPKTASAAPQVAPAPTTKEAQEPMTTPATPSAAPTITDVAMELSKLAADAGLDLTKISKEEYATYFDNLAREMAEPTYTEKKAALEQAEATKLAEEQAADAWADRMGRKMARSFVEETGKIASEHAEPDADDKGGKKDMDEKGEKKDEDEKKEAAMPEFLRRAGVAGHNIGQLAKHKGMEAGKAMGEAAAKHRGKLEAAGGAAAAGAGFGAGRASKGEEKKEASAVFDAAVIKRAQEYLTASGFDPNTGEKVAQVETPPAPVAEEDWNKLASDPAVVDSTARALLEQAGYKFEG